MDTVTIFQFKIYDINTDQQRLSRRWGTAQGIQRVGGVPIGSSQREVHCSAVNSEIWELTAIGFDPDAR